MGFALQREDREWIEARARAVGFDLAGVASVPQPPSSAAEQEDRRYTSWVDAGYAGEMDYLKRVNPSGEYLRGDLHRTMPWARSVIVCAANYNVDAPRSIDPPGSPDALSPQSGFRSGWIARYAWSGRSSARSQDVARSQGAASRDAAAGHSAAASDYHDVLLARLHVLEADLKLRFAERFSTTEIKTRCYVDTGPLPEKSYAVRAGVGWIGKNTCIIQQQQGSWLLLGVIITSLEFASWSVAAPDRCGSCTRCIDACPTDAILTPQPGPDASRSIDASRCIAYLTIEKKGSIAEELRPLLGRQVFGCDICQDVCPWNRKAPVSSSGLLPPRRELINPALDWLAAMDSQAFNRTFRGSPLERTRRSRLLRNVALAMGNSGQMEFLSQLDRWAAGPDLVLAEAAAWAASRLRDTGRASE
ncbi:MAG: tRNA epoxyqueuosine(34) reductase QueG [Acidobacteriaceae bacterium]